MIGRQCNSVPDRSQIAKVIASEQLRSCSDRRKIKTQYPSYERLFVKCWIGKKRYFLRNETWRSVKLLLSCSYSRSYKVLPWTPHDKCPSGRFNLCKKFFYFIWRMNNSRGISKSPGQDKKQIKKSLFYFSKIFAPLFTLLQPFFYFS